MPDFGQTIINQIKSSQLASLIRKGKGVGDPVAYQNVFEDFIKGIKDDLLSPLTIEGIRTPFISIHFSSPFLRKWLRFLDKDVLNSLIQPEDMISPLADQYFENAYDNLPRISNFAIANKVIHSTIAIFIKEDQKVPNNIILNNIPMFTVTDDIWQVCHALVRTSWFVEFLQSGFIPKSRDVPEDIVSIVPFIKYEFGALEVVGEEQQELKQYIKSLFGEDPDEQTIKMLVCMFLSTYYWTINLYKNQDLRQFYVFSVPVSYPRVEIGPERLGTVSYCWTISNEKEPGEIEYEILKKNAYDLIKALLLVEQLEGIDSRWDVVANEDTIRQSCYIDEKVLRRINQLPIWLSDKIDSSVKDGFYEDNFSIEGKIVASSPKIHDVIKDIHSTVNGFRDDREKKLLILTFYSQPGAGKEHLAQIAHYMSLSTDLYPKPIDDDRIITWFRSILKSKDIKGESRDTTFEVRNDRVEIRDDQFIGISNYFVRNCSSFESKKDMRDEIMGDDEHKKIGDLLGANFLCGTLFLDEFNTIDKRFVDEYLRVLDKPYEAVVSPNIRITLSGVLLIIATNNTTDELSEMGFNSAVISRLTNYWTIPPLSERPEDIAVYVNKYFNDQNRNVGTEGQITRINSNAMRLLINTQWEYNYRDLTACLNNIIDRRKRNGIIYSPTISFDEVIYAFRRRNMLIGGKKQVKQ